MSLFSSLLIIATCLITATMSGMFGMVGGMVLMAVLALFLPVPIAFVLHGLIQLMSNGYRAWLTRNDIQWQIMVGYLIGLSTAMALMGYIAFTPEKAHVLISLGSLPYIILLLPKHIKLDITRPFRPFLVGLITTLVNLITGVGGPVLDLFFQNVPLTRHQVVATKAVSQAASHISKIIFYGLVVSAAAQEVWQWAGWWILIPCWALTIIGTRLGKAILDNMQDAQFFRWTQRIILTVGAISIARGLMIL